MDLGYFVEIGLLKLLLVNDGNKLIKRRVFVQRQFLKLSSVNSCHNEIAWHWARNVTFLVTGTDVALQCEPWMD